MWLGIAGLAVTTWAIASPAAYAQAPALFTNKNAWVAAAGGIATTIGFDGIAPAGGFTLSIRRKA
jgi:hypothetical protein